MSVSADEPVVDIAYEAEVSVQIPGGPRFSAQLVAKVPTQYMALRGAKLPDFRYGDSVIMRYLHDGVVYAFRTLVLNMIRAPERILFVSYPREQVHKHSLRQAKRLACKLPCQLIVDDAKHRAALVDLSETGARCVVPYQTNMVMPEFSEGMPIILRLPDMEQPTLEFAGDVKWQQTSDQSVRLGIGFAEAQPAYFSYISEWLGFSE